MNESYQVNLNSIDQAKVNDFIDVQQNALRGVEGWLKVFVVVNMSIAPVLFVLSTILGLIGLVVVAEEYPGLLFAGLIETIISGFFVWKWRQIAKALRDVQPGIVQEVKQWLKISLGWVFLRAGIELAAGMGTPDMLPEVVKSAALGLIGFAIWCTYFNVSERVRITYEE